jgi:hypothetical protein
LPIAILAIALGLRAHKSACATQIPVARANAEEDAEKWFGRPEGADASLDAEQVAPDFALAGVCFCDCGGFGTDAAYDQRATDH